MAVVPVDREVPPEAYVPIQHHDVLPRLVGYNDSVQRRK